MAKQVRHGNKTKKKYSNPYKRHYREDQNVKK
jgi:hypothetical protein